MLNNKKIKGPIIFRIKFTIPFLYVLFCFLFGIGIRLQAAEVVNVKELKSGHVRLLMFGASISAFRGELNIASFQVEDYLLDKGYNAQFLNCGVPGNTTKDGIRRFKSDVLNLYPDIVFILFGTNDAAIDISKGKTTPRISARQYEDNLCYIVKELKKHSIYPVLISPPPMVMVESLKQYYDGPPYSEKGFNFQLVQHVDVLKKVARQEGVPCIDVFQAFMNRADGKNVKLSELLPDGMHPNRKGQRIIATQIIDWFESNKTLLDKISAKEGVRPIECILPRQGQTYLAKQHKKTADVKIEFPLIYKPSSLQVRWKHHSEREYTKWYDLDFEFINGKVVGSLQLPLTNPCCTIQIMTQNNGEVSSIGKVDFLKVVQ